MGDRLFEFDYTTGEPTSMLATAFEPIDANHFRLTIREGVKSWAGDTFKASDVLYTIKSAVESGVHDRYYGNFDVENSKVEDDTHVVIALKNPDSFIQSTLANIPYIMLCEESVKKQGGLEKEDGHDGTMPNCYTGPYIPVKWEANTSITFARNENYWGDKPYFDEVVLYTVTDPIARVNNLLGGDVDLALEPSESQIDAVKAKAGLKVINLPTVNYHTWFLNTTMAPFDDADFRRACALALNYEDNIDIALNGYASHSNSILPTGNAMYSDPDKDGYESFYKTDVELAKEYLAKSKYANNPPTIKLSYMPVHETYATLIMQQLEVIGIKVELVPTTDAALKDAIKTGNEHSWIINNSNTNPYEQLKFYDGRRTFAQNNGGAGWAAGVELTSDLFDKITSEPVFANQAPYYKELQKVLNTEIPSIPLYIPDRLGFMVENLDGFILTQNGDLNFSKCYFK